MAFTAASQHTLESRKLAPNRLPHATEPLPIARGCPRRSDYLLLRQIAAAGLCLAGALTLRTVTGATLELAPIADTTLIEVAPDNNLGAQPFFNCGTTGPNAGVQRNRALIRFDPALQLPPNALIQHAELRLEVVGEPTDGPPPSTFRLHRVLRPWQEGTQHTATSPGLGLPALEGEATWNHRLAHTTNTWHSPGAAEAVDYTATASAQQTVYGVDDSPYSFGPTPGLTADVQAWLERPDSNFGWILIGTAESTPKTARRFGSREDPFNAPRLLVDYALPIRLESPSVAEGQFQFEFDTGPNQAYRVEKTSTLDLTGSWTTLTNVPPSPSPGRAIITDPLANSAAYCRVVAL